MIDLFGTFITAGLFLTTQLKSEFPPLNCNMKGVTKSVISNNIEYQVVNSSFCRKHRVWASAVVALWKDSKRITTSEVGFTSPYSVCPMGNKKLFLWIPPCHEALTQISCIPGLESQPADFQYPKLLFTPPASLTQPARQHLPMPILCFRTPDHWLARAAESGTLSAHSLAVASLYLDLPTAVDLGNPGGYTQRATRLLQGSLSPSTGKEFCFRVYSVFGYPCSPLEQPFMFSWHKYPSFPVTRKNSY